MNLGVSTLDLPPLGQLPHHLGFAVADLDASMASVGDELGLTWREPVRDWVADFRTAAATVRWQLSHVKSTGDNGLVIELLQGAAGTTWYAPHGIAFHHYAFAPADRAHHHAALLASGWSVDLIRDVVDAATSSFGYYTRPGSPRVELCQP